MYAKKYLHCIIEGWTRDIGFTVWIEVKKSIVFVLAKTYSKFRFLFNRIAKYDNE